MRSEANVEKAPIVAVNARAFRASFKSQADIQKTAFKVITARVFRASFKSQADIVPATFKVITAHAFSATFSSEADVTVSVDLINALSFSAVMRSQARVTGVVVGGSDLDGMSFRDLIESVLSFWGIQSICNAPDYAIERAINDINASFQLVWNNAEGRNYFSKKTLEVTLSAGVNSQDLPDNIQNVVGPCRIASNKRTLCPVTTIGELENFEDLYLDGKTPSEPVAYHIQQSEQAGGDSARCVFFITPDTGSDAITFLLDVTQQAPRFSKYDIPSSPEISLPHAYAETLLLPILFYKASSFHLFRQADQKPTIDREYQQAMTLLGLADPLPGSNGMIARKEEKALK